MDMAVCVQDVVSNVWTTILSSEGFFLLIIRGITVGRTDIPSMGGLSVLSMTQDRIFFDLFLGSRQRR